MSAKLATVSFRTESGVAEDESWTVADSTVLSNTLPWRTFRWYKGQRHYSGVYWSATMRALWPIMPSLRRSPAICSRHADVTWG